MTSPLLLTDFRSVSPAHTIAQADSLAWIASAHARSEATLARGAGRPFDESAFREHLARRLARRKLRQLPHIPHTPTFPRDDFAGIGLHLTRQHSQQRGLPSTIRPNQTDTVTIGNRKCNVLK